MIKKFDVQGIVQGLTQEMAERLIECDEGRELPLVVIRDAPVRSTEIRVETSFNHLEMASINALIYWVATNNHITEVAVRALLADRFERVLVEDISPDHYDRIVEYLVDFSATIN